MNQTTAPAKRWYTLRVSVRIDDLPEGLEDASTQKDQSQWIEPMESVLFQAGALSVTLVDAEDHPLHEPDPGALPLWPKVVIEALFDDKSSQSHAVDQLIDSGLIQDPHQIHLGDLEDQAWTRAWMDQFVPMSFGQRLWVCPSHIDPDPSWPVVIRLDPGLAFGSGTHPTTAMCLRQLDQWASDNLIQANTAVLDFGCGSGILAIGAALFGADHILAVDHDPQALVATEDNAKANGCADQIQALSPETFFADHANFKADLVLANILAQPLIDLAPTLMGHVASGGRLVLSGILQSQADAVMAAYRAWDDQPSIRTDGDWVCLAFAQKARSHYN